MKIQYLYTSIYIFIKRKWVTDIISIEKNRWFRKVSSNSEKLLYVFVWLKGQWTLHAWQKFRKHWVAPAPSLLKVFKKKRPSRGTALPRPGNPAKTLPRTEEWKLKHTLSLKTGGRWLLVFSVTARITSSWCHVAASCVFGVLRNWTAGPNIRSRATPLSWAALGGETQALKVSFHLEESLLLDSHPPAHSFRTSPTWKWPCQDGKLQIFSDYS